ncbi:MAG: TraB/GumN family protein [Thiogranum sp.]|nr:TraB/GumN family protein [Thiogranum sp.]
MTGHRLAWNLIGLALLAFTFSAHADSPVWKISRGEHQLYLGGTIHLLGPADYPLPPAFETAYDRAAVVVLETDMQAIESPAFQQAMQQALMYPDTTSLRDVLKPETWLLLEDRLADYGVPIESLERARPGMVVITLSMLELKRLGVAGAGVDSIYAKRAQSDRKTVAALETPQEQIDFIRSMGEGNEDALIIHTLEELEDMPALMNAMKKAWREGDIGAFEAVALDPWKDEFSGLYRSLLMDRNLDWIPDIETMLTTREIELVLVGALHLVGEDGLLAMLKQRGCRVEQMPDRGSSLRGT